MIHYSDRISTKAFKATGKHSRTGCSNCGKQDCTCSVCGDLESLCRPRFFAGQLLTEDELNRLQQYVIEKNRLHNRYLHGWGVVCGLQVACHECEGWVTVQPGYALDPCGNDIVVPRHHDVNLLDLINQCREANRKQRSDCDPLRPTTTKDCPDEEHWCLTIRYDEQMTRPITALRQATGKGCTCGSGGSKGCTCGKGSSQPNLARNASSRSAPQAACEPTRICEGYQFNVSQQPAGCNYNLRDLLAGLGRDTNARSPVWLQLLQWVASPEKLEGTLFQRVVDCFRSLSDFLRPRLASQTLQKLTPAFVAPASGFQTEGPSAEVAVLDQHDALCRFYQAVRDLYVLNPLNTRCQLIDLLNRIDCPPPQLRENPSIYAARIRVPAYALASLLVQYAIDCVCQSLLPPCPPPACDDRLVLACVTLKNGKIVDICNFACRRHAGSFPAMNYWLSAIPVLPILTEIVKFICCFDFLKLQRGVNDRGIVQGMVRAFTNMAAGLAAEPVVGEQATVAIDPFANGILEMLDRADPTGEGRQSFLADDFALPKDYLRRLLANLGRILPSDERDKGASAEGADLEDAGVEIQDAGTEDAALAGEPEAMAAMHAELQALRTEMEALRTELRTMQGKTRRGKS